MNQKLTINYQGKPAYDIMLAFDYGQLPKAVKELGLDQRRFMIICDSNTQQLYLEKVAAVLRPIAKSVVFYSFLAGEKSKNLDTVNLCYEQLIQAGFDRNDVLFALGGGVVGDLTGFVASTYLRGIRFIQLPTSLLSMVDSSIGGKTGVDYKAYKNMVGAFYQPKLVYMNLSVLHTLRADQYYSGMSEIIKHGLIKDADYYQWLKDHVRQINEKNYDVLSEMILQSCQIKKALVEQDPLEMGERALLNFGHTIGHAVEKLSYFALLHGECVSVGMAAATYISLQRGYLNQHDYEDINQTLRLFEQPVNVQGLSVDEIIEVTKHDKKMDLDQIRFILLRQIGHAFIDATVTKEEMRNAILSIQNRT
jgi:3-dehydroquinate synthase